MKKEKTLQDIWEVVSFIKDNAATKTEMNDGFKRLNKKIDGVKNDLDKKIDGVKNDLDRKIDIARKEIKEIKNEMIEHVDGFIALYRKHEVELAAVVSRQNRLERKIDLVMRHLGLELNTNGTK